MSIQIKNTPILFIKKNNQDVLEEVLKIINQILLTSLSDKQVTNVINKIKINEYVDFIRLDGNNLSKEDILCLQEKCFAQDVSGDGFKFYLIDNLEKTNKFIQNSLLKFIEEPPYNTFGFFSVNNIDKLFKTISSRCKIQNITNIKTSIINESIKEINNVLGVVNRYHSLYYLQDAKQFIDEFKKLNYKEIEEFLYKVCDDTKFSFTDQINELLNDIKLNLNKNLIAFKLLKLKGL